MKRLKILNNSIALGYSRGINEMQKKILRSIDDRRGMKEPPTAKCTTPAYCLHQECGAAFRAGQLAWNRQTTIDIILYQESYSYLLHNRN